MNDIRRTILWVIFGFSMVLLWDQWQIHNGKKATFFPAPAQQVAVATNGTTGSVPSVNSAGVPSSADSPPLVSVAPATTGSALVNPSVPK